MLELIFFVTSVSISLCSCSYPAFLVFCFFYSLLFLMISIRTCSPLDGALFGDFTLFHLVVSGYTALKVDAFTVEIESADAFTTFVTTQPGWFAAICIAVVIIIAVPILIIVRPSPRVLLPSRLVCGWYLINESVLIVLLLLQKDR